MRPGRYKLPLAFIVAGLLGIVLFLIGEHYRLPIIPPDDFAKGLWFGTCIGSELLGTLLAIKSKAGPAL